MFDEWNSVPRYTLIKVGSEENSIVAYENDELHLSPFSTTNLWAQWTKQPLDRINPSYVNNSNCSTVDDSNSSNNSDAVFPKTKLDHIVLYRPGTGTIWIIRNNQGTFAPIYAGNQGIGGYDLASTTDRIFTFDYDHNGRQNYLVLYRPGTGTMWILKNNAGNFEPVYQQGDPGNGIGGYDLQSYGDLAFAFDYDHSGNQDHMVLYRPGEGTLWILKNNAGKFEPVYKQGDPGNGIGGYDLASGADRAFAFDYEHSGKMDYIVLYRPGEGALFILKNNAGNFQPVYAQGDPGNGIGGYDLQSTGDHAFAFDYDHSGKMDYIVLYRPGEGAMFILKNNEGNFEPVYAQGDPGVGIGGYDLANGMDLALAFDGN